MRKGVWAGASYSTLDAGLANPGEAVTFPSHKSMSTVTLDEAQRQLPQLVLTLPTEGEIVILGANGPVAKLSPVSAATAGTSLRQLEPRSVGKLLQPYPAPEDDLLEEMRNA